MIKHSIQPLILMFVTALSNAQDKPSNEVLHMLRDVQRLQHEKRYSEALQKLSQIEALAPGSPDVHNLRGSIYLTPALRNFELAKQQFEKAASLNPEAMEARFNQGELLFVKHEWAAAEAVFQKLLQDFPKLPLPARHFTLYKRLVCEVKLQQFDKAQQTLKEHFTFMDDTPAYYYSHAAIAFGQKNDTKAQEWLTRAATIYKPGERSAYVDTLMEARWLLNSNLPPVKKK